MNLKWNCLVFNDHHCIRKKKREACTLKNHIYTVKNRGGSTMLWGCFDRICARPSCRMCIMWKIFKKHLNTSARKLKLRVDPPEGTSNQCVKLVQKWLSDNKVNVGAAITKFWSQSSRKFLGGSENSCVSEAVNKHYSLLSVLPVGMGQNWRKLLIKPKSYSSKPMQPNTDLDQTDHWSNFWSWRH